MWVYTQLVHLCCARATSEGEGIRFLVVKYIHVSNSVIFQSHSMRKTTMLAFLKGSSLAEADLDLGCHVNVPEPLHKQKLHGEHKAKAV